MSKNIKNKLIYAMLSILSAVVFAIGIGGLVKQNTQGTSVSNGLTPPPILSLAL